MNITTLQTRGTDLVTAALKLAGRFDRAELMESYGKLRQARGDPLPHWWKQGVSNELHRLSSDFATFHTEHRKLDLFCCDVRAKQYALRDSAKPLLIEAANAAGDLFTSRNTLLVSRYGDTTQFHNNHLIGQYAQKIVMNEMRSRGYTVIDTSLLHAYDFEFKAPTRTSVPQIMETKGTRASEIDITLTPNEMQVMFENRDRYWLGIVYNIKLDSGQARDGSLPFITAPPIIDQWRFLTARIRRVEATLFDKL